MVNLFSTNSYYKVFSILTDLLKEKESDIDKKKIIFCEAKVSLMVERHICHELGGTFNTSVYSFGKFLRAKKQFDKLLSKEGSAMAIKKILTELSLKCFRASKNNLAPTLYDLIIQLKSAKITPNEILDATTKTKGVLKDKLEDIYLIYSEYEKFIKDNGFEDQSSLLTFLPEIILNSSEIKNADIYLVGFGSFTAQMRSIVSALLDSAKSVTAILTEGENLSVYVNETAQNIRKMCADKKIKLNEQKVDALFNYSGGLIAENLFNPKVNLYNKEETGSLELTTKQQEKIYFHSAKTPYDELLMVGEQIRKLVISGVKYKDITIAISDINEYKESLSLVFNMLDIPYFLDEQKAPLNHPLITLILAYLDIFIKGFERGTILRFIKNPLFLEDKKKADNFENYLLQYNINYRRIFNPFTFEPNGEITKEELEEIRQKLCDLLAKFSVKDMLNKLDVQTSLSKLAISLKAINEDEQSAITEQIYRSVFGLLDEMALILSSIKLTYIEFKNIFSSGVSSLKLSIIPQHNDAVFVGEFKETALAKSKNLFVLGLTDAVPKISSDVSLISDNDISVLEEIKVLVEPKIRVVNHREREYLAMALSSFEERLFLSYPMAGLDGKANEKSEVITCFDKLFNMRSFSEYNGYLTEKQAVKSFARACGEFAEGKTINDKDYDFTIPSSFYSVYDKEKLLPLLNNANKEVKERLTGDKVSLIKDISSPTTIEKFYKCPYYAFVQQFLRIKNREVGEVDVLSIGNIIHEVLNSYIKQIKNIQSESLDKQTSDQMVEEIINTIFKEDKYKKYLSDLATLNTINRISKESKEYCYKTYLSLKKSKFNQSKTEVSFGDGEWCAYPAIPLLDGKIKLKGKIDRVDENDKFFRVIDYKTGDKKMPEKDLYSGTQLQLYLYAGAIREKYQSEKTPSGLYYLPILSAYQKMEEEDRFLATGKTLNDDEAILSNDTEFFSNNKTDFVDIFDDNKNKLKNITDREVLNEYIDYAIKISESAVKNLSEGVIKATPYEKACEYCEYSALCGMHNATPRTIDSVSGVFKCKKGDKADE